MKNNTKTESIKIKVSKLEKEKLKQLASTAGKELAPYIRQKCLCTDYDFLESLPTAIEAWNLLNEICHEIEKCNDTSLKKRIKNILINQEDAKWRQNLLENYSTMPEKITTQTQIL